MTGTGAEADSGAPAAAVNAGVLDTRGTAADDDDDDDDDDDETAAGGSTGEEGATAAAGAWHISQRLRPGRLIYVHTLHGHWTGGGATLAAMDSDDNAMASWMASSSSSSEISSARVSARAGVKGYGGPIKAGPDDAPTGAVSIP
jgi:hypothetical protein